MLFRTLSALFLTIAAFFAPVARAVEPASAAGAPPFVAAAEMPVLPGGELRSFVAARRALELGFPSVAAGLYTELLASLRTQGAERDVLVLELVDAWLDEGRADEAERVLLTHSGAPTPAYHLRAGLIAAQRRRVDGMRTALAATKPEDLPGKERSWWYFLQGQVLDAAGDFTKARDAYQRASEGAASDLQRAHFVLARELARLRAGDVSESQVNSLRQSAERYQGRSVGYAYARQYAVALAARGSTAEAIDYLSRQLQALPAAELAARDDFRLLLGLVAGVRRGEGRNALERLLAGAVDPTLQRVALRLLADGAVDAAFYRTLNDLITATPQHPILEDLLLVRAELGLVEKNLPVVPVAAAAESFVTANQAQTERDAKALLEKFPGSPLKPAALAVLADLAWEMKRYRTAADYAAQARAALPPGNVRAALGVLVAEAWFLAGDFRSAEEAYAAALRELPPGVSAGALIAQRVLSKIEGGELEAAAKLLDDYAKDSRLDAIHRWQAEWTLARALQASGATAAAYARVNAVMSGAGDAAPALPADLRARMAWLQAKLSLDAGEPERTLALAEALPPLLEGLAATLRAEVLAATRLLGARANFDLGRPEPALASLKALREDPQFAATDAAVYSYINEADYYVQGNRFVDAQQLLTTLADKFKNHAYAPYALYRAALNVEQRGQDEYYREAIRILERIKVEYPGSPQVFYALMKQGDLARRLNEFDAARAAYEYLKNNYPQHQGVFAADLALAACHRAQITASDVSHFERALTILERLQDLSAAPIDLRVEAAHQLGDLYATSGRASDRPRAEAVWWTSATTFLLDDAQAARLGARGRYWMARTLLRLGDIRRDQGDLEEARNAYSLLIRKNLPFSRLAREVYLRAGGKS